jgi:hypothetical protein
MSYSALFDHILLNGLVMRSSDRWSRRSASWGHGDLGRAQPGETVGQTR